VAAEVLIFFSADWFGICGDSQTNQHFSTLLPLFSIHHLNLVFLGGQR